MIFVGDIGTNIDIVLTGEVITGAAGYSMLLRKPSSKEVVTVTAGIEGTDTIRYTTIADDIDEAGTWRVQGYLDDFAGWSGYTTIGEFEVSAALDTV